MLHAFFISYPMLTSANGLGCIPWAWSLLCTWAHPANRSHRACWWPVRPAGPAQPHAHLSRLPHWEFALLAPFTSFVSIIKIKVQEGYINDNLELCPNTEAAIWAASSNALSPKARKEKGKLCLSIAFLAQPLSTSPTPCFVSWTHQSCINQLVQGFEISWPNHRIWEILISVYMKLWLWLQTLYLADLTFFTVYAGFDMVLAILLMSGNELSLLVFISRKIIYFQKAFCLT